MESGGPSFPRALRGKCCGHRSLPGFLCDSEGPWSCCRAEHTLRGLSMSVTPPHGHGLAEQSEETRVRHPVCWEAGCHHPHSESLSL